MILLTQLFLAHTQGNTPVNRPGWDLFAYMDQYPALNAVFILSLISGGLLFSAIFSTGFRLLERTYGNQEEKSTNRRAWLIFTMLMFVPSKLLQCAAFVIYWIQAPLIIRAARLQGDSFCSLSGQLLNGSLSLLMIVGLLYDLGVNGTVINRAFRGVNGTAEMVGKSGKAGTPSATFVINDDKVPLINATSVSVIV